MGRDSLRQFASKTGMMFVSLGCPSINRMGSSETLSTSQGHEDWTKDHEASSPLLTPDRHKKILLLI